jgi:hypothetical protein
MRHEDPIDTERWMKLTALLVLQRKIKLLDLLVLERKLALVAQVVFLAATVALTVTVMICALGASPWPVPTGVGGFGTATALLAGLSPRAYHRDDRG